MARLRRHAARAARPLHPPRHGALARPRRRRPHHVPVPRLAVRRRRDLPADPAARGPDQHPGQGQGRRVPVRGALRAAVGGDAGAALRAPGDPRVRRSRLGRRARRPVRLELRRLAPARELHRLRALPVGPPGAARGPGSPRRRRLQRAHRGPRPLLRHRPPRGAQQRRLPRLRQRDRGRAGAPQPLPAAPAVHDPAAAGLGRGEGDGLLLQLAARSTRTTAPAT